MCVCVCEEYNITITWLLLLRFNVYIFVDLVKCGVKRGVKCAVLIFVTVIQCYTRKDCYYYYYNVYC